MCSLKYRLFAVFWRGGSVHALRYAVNVPDPHDELPPGSRSAWRMMIRIQIKEGKKRTFIIIINNYYIYNIILEGKTELAEHTYSIGII